MEESLLKSNFIGRDGFRWWIGQIPPLSTMGKQVKGSGWGNRYKVRIMGYHPANTVELKDEDLPWAQCLLPTTSGTGAANYASDVKLQQGDVVFGFFMDGDNAQVPVILGAFGRTRYVVNNEYSGPFIPFTGYTNEVKAPDKTLVKGESNEQNALSQDSPIHAPKKVAESANVQQISYFDGIGDTVKLGSEKTSIVNKISSELDNFLRDVSKYTDEIQNGVENAREWLNQEIDKRVTKIQSISSGLVNGMVQDLFDRLIPIIQSGLDMLYKQVYAIVLAATGNPVAAHLAGVAAQQAMIAPVKILQDLIPCISNTIINGLGNTIKQILQSVVNNIANFASCVADQVTGGLINDIIGKITVGMASGIGGIQKILQFFENFNVEDFLRSSVSSITGLPYLLNCSQRPSAGSDVETWTIGCGPMSPSKKDLQTILDVANNAFEISNAARQGGNPLEGIQDIIGGFDILSGVTNIPNYISSLGSCYTGPPLFCGAPTVKIFGGGGINGSAYPLMGNLVDAASGTTGSVISVKVTNPGSGYVFPPFVEIVDECGQGYGAVARAVLKGDQIDSIYIVSEGENYPVGEFSPYVIDNIIVLDPGSGYSINDYALDNLGNRYEIQVSNGYVVKVINNKNIEFTSLPNLRVVSDTGSGAIVKVKLDVVSEFQGEVIQSKDCITT